MLVLSRKEGEKIVIGEDVVLTITRIAGNRVTIGIEAPRDVRVARGELGPLAGKVPAVAGYSSPGQSASGQSVPITDTHVALAGCQIQ